MADVRINKYLSEAGVCSRREADRLLAEGRVLVNGQKAVPGQRVDEGDAVLLDGREVAGERKDEPVLLKFWKPRGVVCSTVSQDRSANIIDFIGYKSRIVPIGRLDKDSEGLILLTNRFWLVDAVNRQRHGHEKEYAVSCKRPVTDRFLEQMAEGVVITVPVSGPSGKRLVTERTLPCRVWRTGPQSFGIVLTQGRNRQIRRMCEALGNRVERLLRVRIMNIGLGDLEEGGYREVKGKELSEFCRLAGKKSPGGSLN